MPLDIYELLQLCTVRVFPKGAKKEWGSGFFVAPGLVLTCAHVVKRHQEMAICLEWQNQPLLGVVTVQSVLPDSPDIALLHVELSDGLSPPCVCLAPEIKPFARLYVYGYPDLSAEGGPVTLDSEGCAMRQGLKLIQAKGGQVRPGHSGAPVLNVETGNVCGMVRISRGRSTDFGGLAVPVSVVLEHLPALASDNQDFHRRDPCWCDYRTQHLKNRPQRIPSPDLQRREAELVEALWLLDYSQDGQEPRFQKWSKQLKLGSAFLIQARDSSVQQWLLQRLARQVPNFGNATIVELQISHALKADFDGIWRIFAEKLGEVTPNSDAIIDKLSGLRQTETVIIAMKGIHKLNDDSRSRLINEFWMPLLQAVCDRNCPTFRQRLMLFLTEDLPTAKGYRCLPLPSPALSNPEAVKLPIALEPLIEITSEDVMEWFERDIVYGSFEQQFGTAAAENMVLNEVPDWSSEPEKVLEEICAAFEIEAGLAGISPYWKLAG